MKRFFILTVIAALAVSCGGNSEKVTPPDVSAYKAVETTSKSNSGRIQKLESELDSAKREIDSLRVQNRQLADSYDALVELFKEHKSLTMVLIGKINSLVPEETPEKEQN